MVIPVLDEVNHLPLLLADLEAQDLPASEFDVLVLDGGSSDGTRELLDQHTPSTAHGFVVLENPGRTVPHARNLAMAHVSDDVGVVVELIGHVRISPDRSSVTVVPSARSAKPRGSDMMRSLRLRSK